MTTPLKDRKQQMTQKVIVDAARELFESKGYDETSMEDVAQAAGCSRRTPYNHFETKRNLWYAVVHDDNVAFHGVLQAAASSSSGDALTRYRGVARAGFQFLATRPELDRRVAETQVHTYRDRAVPDRQHEYAKRCAEVNDSIAELILGILRQAQREGSVRDDRDLLELTVFSAGVLSGASSLAQYRLAADEGADLEPVFDRGWQHVLQILEPLSRPAAPAESNGGDGRTRTGE